MKKSLFILLILLLAKSNLSAQVFNLDEDYDANPYISDLEITYKSIVPSVTMSGHIESSIATTVKSADGNIIIIKASEVVFSANPSGGSKGTVIRPKPGVCIGCRDKKPKTTTMDVVLNHTNNDLQITAYGSTIVGYTLYDLSGKMIRAEKTTPANHCNVSTSELSNSIYIIKIDFENQQYKTMKFLKN
ncbi:T9SS type A sorting domain-containing protein [Flavobacterium sp.]